MENKILSFVKNREEQGKKTSIKQIQEELGLSKEEIRPILKSLVERKVVTISKKQVKLCDQ